MSEPILLVGRPKSRFFADGMSLTAVLAVTDCDMLTEFADMLMCKKCALMLYYRVIGRPRGLVSMTRSIYTSDTRRRRAITVLYQK